MIAIPVTVSLVSASGDVIMLHLMSAPLTAMKPTKTEAIVVDKAAIGVSLLCVVHCLSIPFILAFGPVLNLWIWGSEGFHLALLTVVIPLSLVAFGLGYRFHHNRRHFGVGHCDFGGDRRDVLDRAGDSSSHHHQWWCPADFCALAQPEVSKELSVGRCPDAKVAI